MTHRDGVAIILGVKSHDIAGQLKEGVRNIAGLLVPGSIVMREYSSLAYGRGA